MPEVPQNMQQDLQRLEQTSAELDATEKRSHGYSTSNKTASAAHARDSSLSAVTKPGGAGSAGGSAPQTPTHANLPRIQEPEPTEYTPFQNKKSITYDKMSGPGDNFDGPTFSPFPKVTGENIPMSDEEKEEILYNARQHVLHSNNVAMQLSWARDSLAWVEITAEAWQRENPNAERPSTPKIEHELKNDAVNIVEYLSDQGHPEALFMRSKWLEFGKFGQRADKREAYMGYRKAAEQGWGRAEYRMGMLYENSNDMDKAVKHYKRGMEQRDSAASYRLGMMSLLGQHGQPMDYQHGLDLIQIAADSADEDAPQGAYVYGMLIARDLPDLNIPEGLLPSNLALARQYVEKAAFLGFAKAQSKMGQAYELCQLSCDFNPAYSLHYYGLAAKQGQPEASLGVSRWFLFGYEGVFAKNEQLAFQYAKRAADAKLATGEFAMGYYYEIGIHVRKDLREARKWYETAAENGNTDAIGRLESLNNSKSLTKEDHETTTLTRIKSQHGSQRGKRPDRFKQKDSALPPLAESGAGTPVSRDGSPPHNSVEFPDPARHTGSGARPPAFTVNLQNLPIRSSSTAPYPMDDRPPTLNLRPQSVAPYPEDDVAQTLAPVSPHYNPQIRGAGGPGGPGPGNGGYGVRPLSPSGRPDANRPFNGPQGGGPGGGMRQSQSYGSGVGNIPPAGGQPPRGRVVSAQPGGSAGWESQPQPGYRQASASPGGYDQQAMQPMSGPGGPADPTRNRLTKQGPNQQGPPGPGGYGQRPGPGPGAGAPYPPQQQQQQPAVAQPGRDYGPRSSSARPPSEYDSRYGSPNVGGRPQSTRPERLDSLPAQHPQQNRMSTASSHPPQQLKDRPALIDPAVGRQSAPPGPGGPTGRPSPGPSPGPASVPPNRKPVGQAATAPAGKPAQAANQGGKQGPATFEEMGIPQGKNESDCVVM